MPAGKAVQMSGFSVRVKLEKHIIESMKRDDPFFTARWTDVWVHGIQGPEAVGPFATGEDIARLVNHSLSFNKRILMVYDLGERIPPIAVTEGARGVGNGRCDEHWKTAALVEDACAGCRRAKDGDDDKIGYSLVSYGFKTLAEALVFAIALRDRENPNDARSTAQCIQRMLKGGLDG
jgi:hypothetical protein